VRRTGRDAAYVPQISMWSVDTSRSGPTRSPLIFVMPPGGILSGSLSSSVFNFQEFYWYVFLKFKPKTDHGFSLLYIIEVIQPFENISQVFVVSNHYFE